MKITLLALSVAFTTPALAQQDVADFYRGKTVRIVVGVGVGSGYDITARAIARHLGTHIPGNPTVIVQNQPGAGSVAMANAVYNNGPFDGTFCSGDDDLAAAVEVGWRDDLIAARLRAKGGRRIRIQPQQHRHRAFASGHRLLH